MKIISLVNNYSGCDYHRVRMPLTYLHMAGLIQGVAESDSIEQKLQDCDILYYNRIPYNVSMDLVLALRKKYGFKIIVDVDDYWKLFPGHHMEDMWKKQDMEWHICRSLTNADAVTCTTDRLAEKVRIYNRNVFVVPNGLPFGDGQFTQDRKPADRMRFIYAGGGSHLWDVRLLKNTACKLAREQFLSELILAGTAEGVGIYEQMADAMSAKGRLKNFATIQYRPLASYMDLYNDGDVALAPLVGNEFNWHKSNLKILEAGCKAMPVIASNSGPYRDDTNPFIMRVDTPGDWYRWIRWCEQNPNAVKDNGAALREYVKHNYDLRTLNFLRLEAFNSVLQ